MKLPWYVCMHTSLVKGVNNGPYRCVRDVHATCARGVRQTGFLQAPSLHETPLSVQNPMSNQPQGERTKRPNTLDRTRHEIGVLQMTNLFSFSMVNTRTHLPKYSMVRVPITPLQHFIVNRRSWKVVRQEGGIACIAKTTTSQTGVL